MNPTDFFIMGSIVGFFAGMGFVLLLLYLEQRMRMNEYRKKRG